jgi:hypothetical protein
VFRRDRDTCLQYLMDSPKPAGRYRRRPDPLPRESSSSSLDGHSPAELLLITEQDNCSRGKEELLHCETFLPRDFVNIRPLGSGSGGTVFLVRHLATNTVMARKVVHLEIKPAIRQQIVLELRVLHNCRSPQIVGFYGSFCHDGEIHILTEYMDCGSLDMVQARVGRIEENMLRHICFQVLLGLDYLQTNLKVMHRDVKPSNILLNSKGEVKVCDFGICAELTSSIAFSFVGTRFYMAVSLRCGYLLHMQTKKLTHTRTHMHTHSTLTCTRIYSGMCLGILCAFVYTRSESLCEVCAQCMLVHDIGEGHITCSPQYIFFLGIPCYTRTPHLHICFTTCCYCCLY